jgi:hypothetical protein
MRNENVRLMSWSLSTECLWAIKFHYSPVCSIADVWTLFCFVAESDEEYSVG